MGKAGNGLLPQPSFEVSIALSKILGYRPALLQCAEMAAAPDRVVRGAGGQRSGRRRTFFLHSSDLFEVLRDTVRVQLSQEGWAELETIANETLIAAADTTTGGRGRVEYPAGSTGNTRTRGGTRTNAPVFVDVEAFLGVCARICY